MSFYGNILNRLDRFWRTIKVGNVTLEANENDSVEFVGQNGIKVVGETDTKKININGNSLIKETKISGGTPNQANYTTQTIILQGKYGDDKTFNSSAYVSVPELNIVKNGTQNDNQISYELIYGGVPIKEKITIPFLDAILVSGAVVTKTETGNWGPKGTYLELVFKTIENGNQTVYINVADLNEDSSISALADELKLIKQDLDEFIAVTDDGTLVFTEGRW